MSEGQKNPMSFEKNIVFSMVYAGMAELADAQDLKRQVRSDKARILKTLEK